MRAGNTGGAYSTMSVSIRGPVTTGAGVTVVGDGCGLLEEPGGVPPPVHHTFPYEDRQPGVRVLDGVGVDAGGELLEDDGDGVAVAVEVGDCAGGVVVVAGGGVTVGAGAVTVGEGPGG